MHPATQTSVNCKCFFLSNFVCELNLLPVIITLFLVMMTGILAGEIQQLILLALTVTKARFLFTLYQYLFKHSSDENKENDHQG